MKRKLAAIGLSLALAAGAMTTTVQPAKAELGTFLGGLVIGYIVGVHVDHPPLFTWRHKHVSWCEAKYRTYNRYTDLYYYKPGLQRHCVSPYSY